MGNLVQVITKFLFLWSQLGRGESTSDFGVGFTSSLEKFSHNRNSFLSLDAKVFYPS